MGRKINDTQPADPVRLPDPAIGGGSLESMRQPLLRYCRQLAGSPWDAEDLLQDTMVRLLQAAAQRPERELGFRYACRTARNLWIDRARRSKRVSISTYADVGGDSGVSEAASAMPEPSAAQQTPHELQAREHLEELAWRLAPKPFVLLLLTDVFDFTAKEAAAWLGGTETAVQVALSRARSRLRALSRRSAADRGRSGESALESAAGRAERTPGWSGSGAAAFFEAVLDAFRRRDPAAVQEAYLILTAAGGRVQGIRAMGGKLVFTFLDPDGNKLMVTT